MSPQRLTGPGTYVCLQDQVIGTASQAPEVPGRCLSLAGPLRSHPAQTRRPRWLPRGSWPPASHLSPV